MWQFPIRSLIRTPFLAAAALTASTAQFAHATPSSMIFIPSPDIQANKSLHLGIDNYIRDTKGVDNPNYIGAGITGGLTIVPDLLNVEAGIDYLEGGQGGPTMSIEADRHPIYFNGKVGIPEKALFSESPALAVGGQNFGTHEATKQNMVYGLMAKTFPVIGRLSVGGYRGNEIVLGDENVGVLLSWDRVMSEVSDHLWVAVDHLGGDNFNGSTNIGAAWTFSPSTSLLVGYDIYNSSTLGGANTVTTQLDVNFL